MNYLLLIHSDPANHPQLDSDEMRQLMTEYLQFMEDIKEAGIHLSSNRLYPAETATVVSKQSGKMLTTDGPFVETKEQFGGYFLIKVKNRAEALEWAAKIPGARYGSIEVREAFDEGTVD
jgi:hypothetical protein